MKPIFEITFVMNASVQQLRTNLAFTRKKEDLAKKKWLKYTLLMNIRLYVYA